MATKTQAQDHWRKMMATREPRREIQRGMKGDGKGHIRVPGRPDWVYVRVGGRSGALWEVLDTKTADIEDLPVLFERLKFANKWQVIDVDRHMLTNVGDGWEGQILDAPHGAEHEWPDKNPGHDPVDVHPRALTPLRVYPKNQSELKVRVAPLRYTYDGELKEYYGGELDLSSYQPSSPLAVNVLTYLDPRDNTMYGLAAAARTYSGAIPLPIPTMPTHAVPSALVRVWSGRTYITEADITDYRVILDVIEPVKAPREPGYIVTSYSGGLPNERKLAAGAGITLTDEGANKDMLVAATGMRVAAATELTISGGAITRTQPYHRVDTQNDDPSDDLDTVWGGVTGDILVLKPEDDARTVVVKHNTGNIWLKDKADFNLDDIHDHLWFTYDGGKWCDV